jgi:hypothetical protein
VTLGPGALMTDWQRKMIVGGPGTIGQLSGFIVRENANIAVDSLNDSVSGGYSMQGLVYVDEVPVRADPDTSDKSMRGAIEMNVWGSYTWGVYRPSAYGVAMTFDSPLPTS